MRHMQQLEFENIIRLSDSKNIVCHLQNRQELQLTKSSCKIKDGICCADSFFIPCSEILYVTATLKGEVPVQDAKPKVRRKTVSYQEKHKLWQELKACGYRAPFSGRPISESDLANGNLITIEHIVPLARNGSDSFENMTLEFAEINNKRGSLLPSEYKKNLQKAEQKRYNKDIALLWKKKSVSKKKYQNFIK